MKKIYLLFPAIILMAIPSFIRAQVFTDQMKTDECKKVKAACIYAWNGYKQYAQGYDAFKPLSHQGYNWYDTSLCMTPVDAFDTFILMGLRKEAHEAKNLIFSRMNLDVDQEIQLFEVSIRVMGGLLSAYEMDGDQRFLQLAHDLGNRLLPAFSSPTGMPYRFVNLKTGMTRDEKSNPAEIGTYLLEFGKLTQYTGDSIYYKTAKKAAFEVY
ncbi:MAG: glycoside hydrolase family 47 protein, partial [Bacteroidota bacterium]|nr:glycoside hydrolase family 47 protein [Bacteroidota bacterium]